MAVNAYVKIESREGPSASRAGHIDILSFSFGATQTSTYGAGSSGRESRAGRADVGNLTIMKVVDKLSPSLFEDCVTGDNIGTVTLFYDKPLGDVQEDYFKIDMEDVIITSIQLSGSQENPVESISFAFEKVKVCYNPEDDAGKLAGWVEKGYDLGALKVYS